MEVVGFALYLYAEDSFDTAAHAQTKYPCGYGCNNNYD